MFYLKILTWLIWLQNRQLDRWTIMSRLKSFHPAIHPLLRQIEDAIKKEHYGLARYIIDHLRAEHDEFLELVRLQAQLDVIELLRGDD